MGLPNLKDQEVCIAGITAGNDNNANARLTTSIKAFWEELIQASGGRLVGLSLIHISEPTRPY